MHRLARRSFLNAILSESNSITAKRVPGHQALPFRLPANAFLFLDPCGTRGVLRILERKRSAKMAAQSTIAFCCFGQRNCNIRVCFVGNDLLMREASLVSETQHGEEIVDGRPFATVPEMENRQSIGIFLRLRSERYEDALCKYRLRRERMKSRPPMNKPTNVRAKTLGSGVDTVLVVTSH